MSQQVIVDYQGVSIQCKARCEAAVHSLCRIDKVLNRINDTAGSLVNTKIKEYEQYLLESKEKINSEINVFKETLEKYKEARAFQVNNHSDEYQGFLKIQSIMNAETEKLTNLVNDLTGSKLAAIDEMINRELIEAGNRSAESLRDKANGVIDISSDLLNKINEIDDLSLRELVYEEAIKEESKSLTFEDLLSRGKSTYDSLLCKKQNEIINSYKEQLKEQGVSEDVLANVSTIDEANKAVNEAIVGEKVRKETLKVIIKAIKDRGFVVDTKHNLKIDKNTNIVKLVALKASGQVAEFEIQLNGKFMYHFDKYEGQACKKDITPFLEDLKNIYDIDITHEEVTWSNPDKIQTKKYQHINKNKGTN